MARRDRVRRSTNDNLSGRMPHARHRRLRLEPLETRRLLDAARLYVDADSPAADPDGTAWSAAYVDLQAALDQAATLNTDLDDTNDINAIWIADGLYTPTKDKHNNATPDDPRTVTFSMLSGVSLYGAFVGNEATLDDRARTPEDAWLNETILSGDVDHDDDPLFSSTWSNNAYTVVYASDLPDLLTLDALTVTVGRANGADDPSNPEWSLGGGLFVTSSHLTIVNSTIARNSYGGIYSNSGVLSIEGSTVRSNGSHGIHTDGGTLTVTDSTISGNSTSSYGGGIYSVSGSLTISRATFTGNSARQGGAVCSEGGTMTVTDSSFSENSASYSGGAIRNRYGVATITNSTVTDSFITGGNRGGGGIYNGSGATLTVIDSTVSENSAISGGGIFNNVTRGNPGTVTVTNSTFAGNSASEFGGAIYNHYYSDDGGTITVTDSLFSENTAFAGGGIYNQDFGELVIANSRFRENSAENGGAIYSDDSGILSVANSTFNGNIASRNGGGVFCGESGTTTVTTSSFSGNSTSDYGGAIHSGSGSTLIVIQSTIAGNYANSGGGIFSNGGSAILMNSIVARNYARSSSSDMRHYGGLSAQNSLIGDPDDADGVVHGQDGNLVGVNPLFVRNPSDGGDMWGDSSATAVDESANDDYGDLRLLPGSPAVDAGGASLLPSDTADLDGDGDVAEPIPVDLGGYTRIVGVTIDIGAYESQDDLGGRETPATVVTTEANLVDLYDGQISLREAIYYAGRDGLGTDITFDASLANATISLGAELLWIDKSLTIDSSSLPSLTIDGSVWVPMPMPVLRTRGVFFIGGADTIEVRLIGLTLTRAYVTSSSDSSLTLADSTLSHSPISSEGGELTVTSSTFSGSGIDKDGGTLTVNDSTFNECYGGAIRIGSGNATIVGSIFTGNYVRNYSRSYGGAVFGRWATLTIADSTFTGNSVTGRAETHGGAIYSDEGTLTVTNSTLTGNSVGGSQDSSGGGIYSTGTLTVTNSIIALNEGGDIVGTLRELSSHNLIGVDPMFVRVASDGGDGWGDDVYTPDIDELANNDYGDLRLTGESRAIDAGDNALVPEGVLTDLNGTPRIMDGDDDGIATVDIGAYEYFDPQLLLPGDASFDGVTDLSDFNIWNANKFADGTTWATGDFNGDGVTDLSDFNIWNAYKFTSAPQPAPVVREPTVDDRLWADPAWLDELADTHVGSQGVDDVARQNVQAMLATYWQ